MLIGVSPSSYMRECRHVQSAWNLRILGTIPRSTVNAVRERGMITYLEEEHCRQLRSHIPYNSMLADICKSWENKLNRTEIGSKWEAKRENGRRRSGQKNKMLMQK